MKKLILLIFIFPFISVCGYAQGNDSLGKWYFGFGGGFHSTSMKYSDLDKAVFPTHKNLNSGVYSFFIQYEIDQERHFAVKPEFDYLNRGGKLTGIGPDSYDYAKTISDVNYKLRSGFVDFRLPLIYNIGNAGSVVRPYVFIAPIFGFSTGGKIKMQKDYKDGSYFGYAIDVSNANMAKTYLAAALGLGLKFQFNVGENRCFLGLEGNYEQGFSNTYGSKEKNGTAVINTTYFTTAKQVYGTRKFSGFEIKATLGIPFSVFKKTRPVQHVSEPTVSTDAPTVVAPVVEERPCYTLDEIINLMSRGERVEGKTICAIDAINFDFAKSTIKKESYDYLDKLAETLIRTHARIEVKGHTDNIGTPQFNMKLSKERAEAVMTYLIKKGVQRARLTYSYYGLTKPLTTNDTEEGRTMNRRVEFEILK